MGFGVYQGLTTEVLLQGQSQAMSREGGGGQMPGAAVSAGGAAAMTWRDDYGATNGPLTGMGQRSASASNLAAMNSLSPDWFTADQRKAPYPRFCTHYGVVCTAGALRAHGCTASLGTAVTAALAQDIRLSLSGDVPELERKCMRQCKGLYCKHQLRRCR